MGFVACGSLAHVGGELPIPAERLAGATWIAPGEEPAPLPFSPMGTVTTDGVLRGSRSPSGLAGLFPCYVPTAPPCDNFVPSSYPNAPLRPTLLPDPTTVNQSEPNHLGS